MLHIVSYCILLAICERFTESLDLDMSSVGRNPPKKILLLSFPHKMGFSLRSPGGGNIGVKLDCEVLVNLSGLVCLKNRKQNPIPALTLLHTGPGPTSLLCTLELPTQPAGWGLGGRCRGQMTGMLRGPGLPAEAPMSRLTEMEDRLPLSTMERFCTIPNKAYTLCGWYLLGEIHREPPNLSPSP